MKLILLIYVTMKSDRLCDLNIVVEISYVLYE